MSAAGGARGKENNRSIDLVKDDEESNSNTCDNTSVDKSIEGEDGSPIPEEQLLSTEATATAGESWRQGLREHQ